MARGLTLPVGLLATSLSAALALGQTHRLPTATEVFQLRSLCAKMAEAFLEESIIGSALTKDQISNYDPNSNRCYIELTVQKINPARPGDYMNRSLYDGQTKELLAFARIEKGQKVGMIFDKQRSADPSKNLGWDDASAYIDEKMFADRSSDASTGRK
jgi:hypothetical protein